MFTDFFRRTLQVFTIGLVGTVLYLNLLLVPRGHVVFLDFLAGEGSSDLYAYPAGTHFVPTLFVPNRWRRFNLDVSSQVQDIRIKIPLKYSAYLRLGDLFYIQLRLKIEGEIPAVHAQAALKALALRPHDRDKTIEEEFSFLVVEFLLGKKDDEQNLEQTKTELRRFFAANNLGDLQARLNTQLKTPWFELKRVELKEISLPDTQIYLAQTRNLAEVAQADRRQLLKQIEKDGELAIERKRNLEDMAKAERMAGLIADHPDILEYYKIEKIAARAGSVILDASSGVGATAKNRNIIINPATNAGKSDKRGLDGKGEKDGDEGGGGEIGKTGGNEKRLP